MSRLRFRSDGLVYEGICTLRRQNMIRSGDKIVIAWMDGNADMWLMDGDFLHELRRYYLDQGMQVEFTILVGPDLARLQDREEWALCSEWIFDDRKLLEFWEDLCTTDRVQIFQDLALAEKELAAMQHAAGFMGGNIVKVTRK